MSRKSFASICCVMIIEARRLSPEGTRLAELMVHCACASGYSAEPYEDDHNAADRCERFTAHRLSSQEKQD